MANKQKNLLPIVMIGALILVVVAIIGVDISGNAAWSTGENTKRTTYTSGCTDTDNGMDFDEAGTVTVGGKSYPDACSEGRQQLTEYYCYRGVMKSYTTWCECANEKCINEQTR